MSKAHSLRKELACAIRAEHFDLTPTGLYFPKQGVLASGEYFGRVNAGAWEKEGDNLVPTEGLAHILNVALGAAAKPAGYYLAIFSGSAAPAANWAAASFTAVANEIVSLTEGHTGATRPAWTPSQATEGSIGNLQTVATLTIATATQLNVTGAALLTNNQRGGVTGALVSATLYAAPRTFQNGDTYELGYRLSLSV